MRYLYYMRGIQSHSNSGLDRFWDRVMRFAGAPAVACTARHRSSHQPRRLRGLLVWRVSQPQGQVRVPSACSI